MPPPQRDGRGAGGSGAVTREAVSPVGFSVYGGVRVKD